VTSFLIPLRSYGRLLFKFWTLRFSLSLRGLGTTSRARRNQKRSQENYLSRSRKQIDQLQQSNEVKVLYFDALQLRVVTVRVKITVYCVDRAAFDEFNDSCLLSYVRNRLLINADTVKPTSVMHALNHSVQRRYRHMNTEERQ